MKKVFLSICVLVAASAVFASTWKEAVDGLWNEEGKWDGGVPAENGSALLPLFPGTTSYKVTVDDMVTAAPVASLQVSELADVAEDGRTATLEITNATMTLPVSAANGFKIYRHGKVHVCKGARLSVEPTSGCPTDKAAVYLNYRGALLHVDGGTFELKDRYLHNCNGWSSGISAEPSELRISSGAFNATRTSTAGWCYYGYGYGRLVMTGGEMNLTNLNEYSTSMLFYSDSVGLDLSGSSTINLTKGSVTFGRGTFRFGESAKMAFLDTGRFYLGYSDSSSAEKSATLKLSDESVFDMYKAYVFQLGSKERGSGKIYRSKSIVDITGGNHRFGYFNIFGCGDNATTLSISNATVMIPRVGISVGSPFFADKTMGEETGYYPTGTVNVAKGGVLSVGGDGNNASYADKMMIGFVLGNGTVPHDDGGWYAGALTVGEGAIVTNGLCPFVVGIGLGEGRVTQTGGTVYSTGEYGLTGPDFGPRGSWEAKPVVIGSFGAKGDYVMSDGTSTFKASVFLGGIESNRFYRTFRLPSHEYCDGKAVGTLCVTGGTFKTSGWMFAGLDGTGVLQAGGEGKVEIGGGLVLSNAVRSVVKVSPRADGTAPIAVSGALSISDAAELEVDVSSIAEDAYGKFPLISYKTKSGDFDPDKVTIIGGPADGRLVTRATATGGVLCYNKPRGLVLLLR